MTVAVPIPSTLSTGAREALTDLLTAGVKLVTLLDTDSDAWTGSDAIDAGIELAHAGYGRIEGSAFYLQMEPVAPAQLPSDTLDEVTVALETVDHIVDGLNRSRTPENPNPTNPLGTSFAVLLQLQNVLRLAVYGQQGRLTHADITRQLPMVATMLARAVQQEVT